MRNPGIVTYLRPKVNGTARTRIRIFWLFSFSHFLSNKENTLDRTLIEYYKHLNKSGTVFTCVHRDWVKDTDMERQVDRRAEEKSVVIRKNIKVFFLAKRTEKWFNVIEHIIYWAPIVCKAFCAGYYQEEQSLWKNIF